MIESKASLSGSSEILCALRDKANCVGWIVSERLVNIPHQIAVPLYKNLVYDIIH